MQKLFILFLFIAMYVSASSAEILSPYIQLSTSSMTINANPSYDYNYLELSSNTGWTLNSDNPNFFTSQSFGVNNQTIRISANDNYSAAPRLATLTIRDSANIISPQYVKVYQKGFKESLIIDRSSLTFTKLSNSSSTIGVYSNTSWTFTNVPSWLKLSKTTGSNNSSIEFVANELPNSNSRSAIIELKGQFGTSHTITLEQVNEEPYVKFHTNYMKIPAKLPNGNLYIGIKSNTHWNVSTDAKLPISYLNGSGMYNSTVSIGIYSENGPVARTATFTATAKGAPTQYLVVEQEAAEPYLNFSVDTLFFTNIPNSSNTIAILSNTSWTMTNMPKWLNYKKLNSANIDYSFTIDNDSTITEGKIDFITNTALAKTLIVKKIDELPKIQTSVSSVTISNKRNSNNDYKFKISANTNFYLKSSARWVGASRYSYNKNIYYISDKDTISLFLEENTSASPRSATISGEKDGVLYPFLEVVQESSTAFINISSTIALEKEANSSKVFNISSNTSWTISNLPNWLSVNKNSGVGNSSLTFTTDDKLITTARTGEFEIKNDNLPSKTISVIQIAENPFITLSVNSLTVSDNPDIVYSIDVKSNTNWYFYSYYSFIKPDPTFMGGYGNGSFTFTCNKYLNNSERIEKISFCNDIYGSNCNAEVNITQLKTREYIDLEIIDHLAPFDDKSERVNVSESFDISVVVRNNSTCPMQNVEIRTFPRDCYINKGEVDLKQTIDFIDTGANNIKIVNMGKFRFVKPGRFYTTTSISNQFDRDINNNILNSKCIFFDNPEVTKVEDEPLGDFRIYPNPNNGYFNISGYEAIDYLRIVDLLGNTIYEQEKPTNSIALNNINAGVYWVLVTSNGISKMEKLFIN